MGTAIRFLARLILVVEVVLGVLFWTGHGSSLVLVHIAIGVLLVLALWAAALLARQRGAPIPLLWLAFLWGLLLPVFGLTQTQIAVGGGHWVVQVLHLAAGVIAVGLVEMLTRMGVRPQSP